MTVREKIQELNPEMKNIRGIRKYAKFLDHEIINCKLLSMTENPADSSEFYLMFNIKDCPGNNIECMYWEMNVYKCGRVKSFYADPDFNTECKKYKSYEDLED